MNDELYRVNCDVARYVDPFCTVLLLVQLRLFGVIFISWRNGKFSFIFVVQFLP
jgi:hypothetical protein